MARRKPEECPICSDTELNSRAWYALQEANGDYKAAAAPFYTVDPNMIRDHFQYHRIVQPAPANNLRRDHALEKGRKMVQRAQDIVLLVSRVPALSATEIAEIFFWNGTAKQMSSARNACYRQLRYLLYRDMLYRIYPGPEARLAETEGGKGDAVSIYFLGRDGVPLVEEREHYTLTRRQWVTKIDDAGEDWKMRKRQEGNEVVLNLLRQMKANPRLEIQGLEAELSFSYLNWIADRRMFWRWRDAVRGSTRLYLQGLAAFGIDFPSRQASFLLPFTYIYDSGSQSAETVAKELINYGLLERSDLLHQLIPEMPVGFVPPLLVVCRDPERAQALRDLAQKNTLVYNNKPLIITIDQTTLQNHGLYGQGWISLWDNSPTPQRHQLITVLLQGIQGRLGLPSSHQLSLAQRKSDQGVED